MQNSKKHWINFSIINRRAISQLPDLLQDWLPDGYVIGGEYTAINPKRADRQAGSFKINMRTGRWSDFSTGDAGGDIVSLYAYLHDVSQYKAALCLADYLGVNMDRL